MTKGNDKMCACMESMDAFVKRHDAVSYSIMLSFLLQNYTYLWFCLLASLWTLEFIYEHSHLKISSHLILPSQKIILSIIPYNFTIISTS